MSTRPRQFGLQIGVSTKRRTHNVANKAGAEKRDPEVATSESHASTKTVQNCFRRAVFHLLVFNILCQDRELLLHYAILPLIPEGCLALGGELVFEAIPV